MEELMVLGDNLKAIRNKMGLSLGDVSSATGVSKTMLSQIERSESVPTLATMWKIANGLKIKFETLLETTAPFYDVNNIQNMNPITDDKNKVEIYCIFPFSPLSGFEYFYGIFKPGCQYYSTSHANCKYECIFVSDGEIEIIIDSKKYTISKGGFIRFDAKVSHTYINNTDKEAVVHFIANYE